MQFDIIIVGAGSAGCVLANRLSEDPSVSVLLIEAGPSSRNPLIGIPVGTRKLFQYGLYQWGDRSEPEPAANGQVMPVPHGKLVGGTGALNFMAFVRGNRADYSRWCELGAEGWSYEEVLPWFRQLEDWQGEADPLRGSGGPVGVLCPAPSDPLAEGWFRAAAELGLPSGHDYNGASQDGLALMQYNIRAGRRAGSAAAFLAPARKRSNLTVMTGAHVTRVTLRERRATGIEFRRRGGPLMTATARRQVILSAGAINSPHLLQLSGIGPAAQLARAGITPQVELPVGEGLEDHLAFPLIWTRTGPDPFHLSLRLDRAGVNMLRAWALRRGPLASLPGGMVGFFRSREGLAAPDLQLILPLMSADADTWLPWRRPRSGSFVMKVNLMSQQSRGSVFLSSPDPVRRPQIRFNALSHPQDIEVLRQGYRIGTRLAGTQAMAPFRAGLAHPARGLESDDEIDAFIRANASQQFHPSCTCAMGRVLNPDFSVRGVTGLYVVDASAMPALPTGNPNAVIMMMALRAPALWQAARSP